MTIILTREDINNPLHPALWEQLCEELGVLNQNGEAPDTVEIAVKSAKAA